MNLNDIAVVIGMPRAGTTWLYENLKTHPDICVSDYKEINRYLIEMSDEQYRGYFRGCSKNKTLLDISPLYYFDKNALAEIARKHSKVILLVRSPDGWIKSLNSQINKYGGNGVAMSQTKEYVFPIERGKTVIFNYREYQHERYIDEIKSLFVDKLLVLDFTSLQNAPVAILKMIEHHLGISNYFAHDNVFLDKINTSEQSISKIYSFLLRSNMLHQLIPVVLFGSSTN